jgi:hypothetical protein
MVVQLVQSRNILFQTTRVIWLMVMVFTRTSFLGGKSLIDSRWVKLKYKSDSCTCTETSLCEKWFQDILSRMMSVSSCSTQFMTFNSWREFPTFFVKKYTLKLDLHSLKLMSVVCCIGEKWCEEWYNILVINDLTELNEYLVVEIPPSARVYPSGRHGTVIPIVVMCVDNNGLKKMDKRTCIRFDVSLKSKSETEIVPEVSWVVSWGEVCLTSHKWFRICSDITQMVQNLWIKNERFILPLESFYISKSTVSPIVTLLKCQSTWICSP